MTDKTVVRTLVEQISHLKYLWFKKLILQISGYSSIVQQLDGW
jgi:hypothetical protein